MNGIFERAPGENKKRRICMLMVTHSCNLNCTYCYEHFKDSSLMDLETAKRIVSEEMDFVRHDDRFDELEIDFMGGEPLTNFALIRDIVEWLERLPDCVPYICFASTNGTLLDDERKAWFEKHRDRMVLGVSIDGTEEMQVGNRGENSRLVDRAYFHATWPNQPFHMVISRQSLPSLAQGVLEIQRKGYLLNAALAQGEPWTTEDARIYREQLITLSLEYLGDSSLRPINLLSPLIFLDESHESVQKKFCGAGTYMCTYDTDGRRYGCHMFSPIVLGPGARELETIKWQERDVCSDAFCRTCVIKQVCPTCAGFNLMLRDGIGTRDKRMCCMALAQFKVACDFQIKRLAQCDRLCGDDIGHARLAFDAYRTLKDISDDCVTGPFTRCQTSTDRKGGE